MKPNQALLEPTAWLSRPGLAHESRQPKPRLIFNVRRKTALERLTNPT